MPPRLDIGPSLALRGCRFAQAVAEPLNQRGMKAGKRHTRQYSRGAHCAGCRSSPNLYRNGAHTGMAERFSALAAVDSHSMTRLSACITVLSLPVSFAS